MSNQSNKFKILCLIPARGGSKSIPRKNIIELLGKPLIAWSIQHGLESKYINRVIVSTDDEEIANISREYGAEAPFLRPADLATDASLDIEAFFHALSWLKENENYEPDLVVQLRPTGPSRRIQLIDKAIETILSDQEADSLRSVSVAHQNPFKMWFIEKNYMLPALTLEGVKDSHSIGRQMLPIAYWQNGYVDIIRPSTILNKKSMVGDKVIPFIIKEAVCDLDYLDDIPKIEAIMRNNLDNDESASLNSERLPV